MALIVLGAGWEVIVGDAELYIVHHRQAVDPSHEEPLGLAIICSRGGSGDHDRLGPGDGPDDGRW